MVSILPTLRESCVHMPESSVRFCIADEDRKLRAASWKVWSPKGKNDVYVACRELGGAIKVSLHESGFWHLGYDQKFYDEKIPKDFVGHSDRFALKWIRPSENFPGVTFAIRILTPHSSVASVFESLSKLHIIKPPVEDRAVEVGIFLSVPTSMITSWPAKKSMKSDLVGTYELPNQSRVWVVSWECEIPDFSALSKKAKRFQGVDDDEIPDSLRAIVLSDHRDGSKALYDLKVRVEK